MARYAVIGNPISHSKSPIIHKMFAEQTGQDIQYDAILVERNGFDSFVLDFFGNQGAGLNVTVPHKQRAFEIANKLAPRAELAGAVNTLLMGKGNTLHGDNTDGTGLICDLQNNHQTQIEGKSVLVIGAGGAVRGALMPLIEAKPSSITLVNRTLKKAKSLQKIFKERFELSISDFDRLEGEFDLIINGTSLSLKGEVPSITPKQLGKNSCCYDMAYGNEDTAFVSWAKNNGASSSLDGLGMLVEQAAESFLIWRGVKPETAPIINALRIL